MNGFVDLGVGADALGALTFRGPDTAKFLQGQVSADTEKLVPGRSVFAGLHNPQGRVIALLALVRTAADEFLAALPAELLAATATRLRKYVLRSKVRIEMADVRVFGAAAAAILPDVATIAWGERSLLLVPQTVNLTADHSADDWRLADVRAGLPQVYSATCESFVAQMLNLDLLGAIAFDKGCYTGQEVIARAHYRGRVKRRMQRWRSTDDAPVKPGDSVQAADGRSLTVVRVAPGSGTGRELLAIGTFAAAAETSLTAAESASADRAQVEGPLPLPYVLPE
jgi:folate-binding protein YgfZ